MQNMRKKMPSKFTPVSVVKKRPDWMTPGINPTEVRFNFTPISVVQNKDFFDTKNYAINNALSQFPEKEQENTDRDAYRHLLWLGMLTQKYGADTARKIGQMHESKFPFVGSPMQSDAENEVDLYNNDLGIELGSKTNSLPELMNMAKQLVKDKKVKVTDTAGSY